jgi:hypothetical protein
VVKRYEGFVLAHDNLIFARTEDDSMLVRMRKEVTGLAGIICSSEGERILQAVKMPDDHIQELIAHCEAERAKESEGIVVGSFVRVLDGGTKSMCGFVESIDGILASIRISYLTKYIYLTTPIRNLLNLDHVEPARRVYYYSALVAEVEDTSILAADLAMTEEQTQPEEEPQEEIAEVINLKARDRSTMATLRALIEDGEHDPKRLATKALQRMNAGETDKIGNLFMLHCFVKQLLAPFYPECKSWREVQNIVGYRQGVPELKKISDGMGLDIIEYTPDNQKRGRVNMRPNKIDWHDPEAVSRYNKAKRDKKLADAASQQG